MKFEKITPLGSQLFCVFSERPNHYQFIFEFMDKGSLDKYVKGGLKAEQFKSIWIQIMRALNHLHFDVGGGHIGSFTIHHDLKQCCRSSEISNC